MNRVWIAGPRAWENPEPIRRALKKLIAGQGITGFFVVTGGATGVDRLAEDVCYEEGVHCVRVRACWPVGRKAGPIRNAFIARELRPHALIAFHYMPLDLTNHRGTQNAIKQAKRLRIPTKILRFPTEVAIPSAHSPDSPMGNRARAQRGLAPKPPKRSRRKR